MAEREGTLVAMYDTELFGHWWWEGPEFLYEVASRLQHNVDVEMASGGDVLDEAPARHAIDLPEGSWGEGGYHHIWLNRDNIWTWEQLYPAEKKMRQMAREYANGPYRRILTQAGRELLLAEASDWQFLISTWSARDYSEIRFADHIERFNKLAEILNRASKGTPPNTADEAFVEDCERKDACFPELDPTWWAQLERPLPRPVPS